MSTAIPDTNPEVAEARRRGLTVLSRAEALAAIAACRRCVAVSGTHGKTTTTSMLALILIEAGLRPSFLIGGDVNEIGTNAVWDSGEWMVLEADESDGTFLQLDPEIAVVTNVEPDHLDYYGDFDHLVEAFDRFLAARAGGAVVGADDPVAARLGAASRRRPGGEPPARPPTASRTSRPATACRSPCGRTGELLGRVALPVTGANIARNAAVAVAASLRVGAPFDAAQRALARFAGVARRFESRGEAQRRALRRRLRAPAHRGGRRDRGGPGHRRPAASWWCSNPTATAGSRRSGEQFADAFSGADVVVVTDVFAAGESPLPGVTGRVVADAVRRAHPGARRHLRARARRAARPRGRPARPGRPVPDPRGRRPHVAARRAPGDHAVVSAGAPPSRRRARRGARRRRRRARRPRATRHAPLGARTTYRVGGSAGVLVEAQRRGRPRRRARALVAAGVARPAPGAGRGLEPPRGRRRLPRRRGPPGRGFRLGRDRGAARCGPGGRQAPRRGPAVGRGRAARPGVGRWGCRDRWAGPCG